MRFCQGMIGNASKMGKQVAQAGEKIVRNQSDRFFVLCQLGIQSAPHTGRKNIEPRSGASVLRWVTTEELRRGHFRIMTGYGQ
jgi:hypothetical protein